MASSVTITGYIRGLARALFAEGLDQPAQLTSGGELLVALGLPQESEIARLGQLWIVVGTAVAPVAAIPTTAAHLSLYNGDPSKSLLIHAVGSVLTTSMAVAGQIAVLARNDVPGFNVNPAGALIIAGTSGKQYSGRANAKASVTLGAIGAGNNVAWVPTGASALATAATTIGVNAHSECFGRWVVQPTGLFSLATLAQTAAGSAQPYIVFSEAVVPLP
jgi:hypothetical protein